MAEKKRKFSFIVRVQDIGLFHGIIQTRGRLMIAAAAGTALALGILYIGSAWMRNSSASSMMNVLFISLMLCSIIVAAYIDGLLIGDLFFPGKWRERVLLGQEVDIDESIDASTIKEYNPHFILVFLGLILALFWLSQKLTDGYIWYYEDVGFAVTLMRSDDPEERYFGLEEIADPIRKDVWQNPALHKQVTVLVDDADEKVQAMAIYVAGRLDVVSAAEPILKHFRETSSTLIRYEAGLALGRLQWKSALPHMSSHLAKPDLVEEESIGILHGFAFVDPSKADLAGPSIVALLESCSNDGDAAHRLPEDTIITAFYAIRKLEFAGGREIARRYLEKSICQPTLPEQCSAADALRVIATKDDIAFLKRRFKATERDNYCDLQTWSNRIDGHREITETETLRGKILRSIGNQRDDETYEWIWKIGDNKDEHPETRKVAEIYTRAMYEAYEEQKRSGKSR